MIYLKRIIILSPMNINCLNLLKLATKIKYISKIPSVRSKSIAKEHNKIAI